MEMKKIYILIISAILFTSCNNFETEKYHEAEYEAINDLILEMTDYQNMSQMNNYGENKLTIYLSSTLNTETATMTLPNGWITGSNGVKYSKDQVMNYKFNVPNLIVKISKDSDLINHNLKKSDFGNLEISRIIFNADLNKGYLHYTFFCGQGCFWNNNIEIRKINDKWQIVKYYSGGIA